MFYFRGCTDESRPPNQSMGSEMEAITTTAIGQGMVEIVVNRPPVNALDVAGWFELARQITQAGEDSETRVVILRSEGRGFNAGVDIKEMQATEGFDALIDGFVPLHVLIFREVCFRYGD